MAIKFEYELIGPGWAKSEISDGKHSLLAMRVSYLSDALADLTQAILRLLCNSEKEEVAFMDEPGEYHWVLQRCGRDLHVKVEWFDDWVEWGHEATCEEVFSAECSLIHFAREVESALDRLLEKHGISGYKEEWYRYGFPVESHARLKDLLSVEFNVEGKA